MIPHVVVDFTFCGFALAVSNLQLSESSVKASCLIDK